MSIPVRLLALLVAVLSMTSVAFAARPGDPGRPDTPGTPDVPGKPDGTPGKPDDPGKPDGTPGKPENPGKPDGTPGRPDNPGKPDGTPGKPDGTPGRGKDGTPPAEGSLPIVPGRDSEPVGDPAHTVLGSSLGATPMGGAVKVLVPGSDTWVELTADRAIPVGSVVDTRGGALELGSETATGVEQHAVVGGAVFAVEQPAALLGVTDIVLRGDTSACTTAPRATPARRAASAGGPMARAAAASRGQRKRSAPVRSLWASGKGRFRTRGSNAVATVRGTSWIVADYCDATTVKVVEGVVDVTDRHTGKVYTVTGGHRHVVRR